MDAFLHFLSQTRKYGHRLFISEAPGPVFLIWCNFKEGCKIAGLTLVRQENCDTEAGLSYRNVLEIIKMKLENKLPVMEIIYNDGMTVFTIDGTCYDSGGAARRVAEKLSIKLGNKPAKRPNDPTQLNDGFHLWSRAVFDGIAVRKADIDAILLNENGNAITAIIEMKRSAKNRIGHWTPYMAETGNTDYWNYIIGITFSKMVAAHFWTFHHELMTTGSVFTEATPVEAFAFKLPTIVSGETIRAFAADANRKVLAGKDFTT